MTESEAARLVADAFDMDSAVAAAEKLGNAFPDLGEALYRKAELYAGDSGLELLAEAFAAATR